MLAGLAAVAAGALGSEAATTANAFLELKTWRLHNSHENQLNRVTQFLEQGLAPGLSRAGSKLAGAFSLYIGPDAPSLVTLTQFASLAAMQDTTAKLAIDHRIFIGSREVGNRVRAAFCTNREQYIEGLRFDSGGRFREVSGGSRYPGV